MTLAAPVLRAQSARVTVLNPFSGAPVGDVPAASDAEVQSTVLRAK